jgi:hypothetical protein
MQRDGDWCGYFLDPQYFGCERFAAIDLLEFLIEVRGVLRQIDPYPLPEIRRGEQIRESLCTEGRQSLLIGGEFEFATNRTGLLRALRN